MGRLTDNDKKFGPITYGKSNWGNKSIILSSFDDNAEGDDKRASLIIYMFNYVFRIWLGNLIKPVMYKVRADWDEETIKRMGRNWYPHYFPRKYGFSLSGGFLRIYFGMDREDDFYTYYTEDGFIGYKKPPEGIKYYPFKKRSWSNHLPWTQLRTYRDTLYDDKLNIFHEIVNNEGTMFIKGSFDEWYKKKEECPTVSFLLRDYDGKEIIAKTYIEEREYRKGEGKFKWLSLFYKPIIHRSLQIEFDKETGPEKGSWKGGTTGCSIEIKDYDNHSSGIQKYCHEEHRSKNGKYSMTFIKELT